MYTFGLIGCGNMGSALARAARRVLSADQLILSNKSPEKAASLANELGCTAATNEEVARTARFLLLGVKPQVLPEVLRDIRPILEARTDRFVLVSMAAGVTIPTIRGILQAPYPILRIMPNVAASVGEGMILLTPDEAVTEDELADFCKLLHAAGRLDTIPESQMNAGCALSGSGPAFAYLFIEAMADGAVACGLPRDKALDYAAQTLLGSARLMLETGRHPAKLKDAVCSPGGTTIAGIAALEEGGVRGSVIRAVLAACQRADEMG